MRIRTLVALGAVTLAIALTEGARTGEGAVLCRKRSGVIVVRDPSCKRKESPLDLGPFVAESQALVQITGQVATLDSRVSSVESRVSDVDSAVALLTAREPYREIGAPGRPPFQNACLNIADIVPGISTAAFHKDPFGVVHLKGLVRCPEGFVTAFTLPPGYRPSQEIHVLTSPIPSSLAIQTNITTGGEVG